MVGVQGVQRYPLHVIEWLAEGGREQLYQLVEELEARYVAQGILGDFSLYIALPQDVHICYQVREGVVRSENYGITDPTELHAIADDYNQEPDEADMAQVMLGRDVFGLADDEVFTDVSWHGHQGAQLIAMALDEAMGEQMERSGIPS